MCRFTQARKLYIYTVRGKVSFIESTIYKCYICFKNIFAAVKNCSINVYNNNIKTPKKPISSSQRKILWSGWKTTPWVRAAHIHKEVTENFRRTRCSRPSSVTAIRIWKKNSVDTEQRKRGKTANSKWFEAKAHSGKSVKIIDSDEAIEEVMKMEVLSRNQFQSTQFEVIGSGKIKGKPNGFFLSSLAYIWKF